MNRTETSVLLSLVRSYDNRKADDAAVLAWHAVLHDLDLIDCQQAVVKHMGTSDAYLMPVHIVRLVAELDRERRKAIREARESELLEIEQADPTRRDRSDAVKQLISELRERLPEGDPDSLRYGSAYWRQVREARERQEQAEPNPHYDPAVAAEAAKIAEEAGR